MTANINPDTGIPYGIIKADAIDPDLWDELTIHNGKNITYEAALEEHLAQERRQHEAAIDAEEIEPDEGFDEDSARDEFNESYEGSEECYAGERDGVQYQTTWLGGAQLLYVFKSPVLTKCAQCSPCVPNAGDLDNVGEYLAYGVPVDWLTEDFLKEQCDEAGFEFTSGGIPHFWRKVGDYSPEGGPFAFYQSALADCYSKKLQVPVKHTLIYFDDRSSEWRSGPEYLTLEDAAHHFRYAGKGVQEVVKVPKRGMKAAEIREAVDAGKRVHWSNTGYKVIKDCYGYLIVYYDQHAIGLTHQDGVTLNGKEEDFFIAEE